MNDKQNITIRIADVPKIPLSIHREDEELVRIAEKNVNSLWGDWSEKFKEKSSKEILAMVAYQFAKLYYTSVATNEKLDEMLLDFENGLDEILLKID